MHKQTKLQPNITPNLYLFPAEHIGSMFDYNQAFFVCKTETLCI